MKIKNVEDLRKHTALNKLSRVSDAQTTLLHVYLDCRLKGGKLRQLAHLAAGIMYYPYLNIAKDNKSFYDKQVEEAKLELDDYFKTMLKEKKWTVKTEIIEETDFKGRKRIIGGGEDTGFNESKIVIRTETVVKKTFFLDDVIDIQSVESLVSPR